MLISEHTTINKTSYFMNIESIANIANTELDL